MDLSIIYMLSKVLRVAYCVLATMYEADDSASWCGQNVFQFIMATTSIGSIQYFTLSIIIW